MAERVTRITPETGSSPAIPSHHSLAILREEVDRLFDSFFPAAFGRGTGFTKAVLVVTTVRHEDGAGQVKTNESRRG